MSKILFLITIAVIISITGYASQKPCIEDKLEQLAKEYQEKANIAYLESRTNGSRINQGYYMALRVRMCMWHLKKKPEFEHISDTMRCDICVESQKKMLKQQSHHLMSMVRRPQVLYSATNDQLSMLKEIQEIIEKEYDFTVNQRLTEKITESER